MADAALIRNGYRNEKETWIDLDHPTVWAVPPTPNTIERRRLLRVPAWSTIRKAPLGGFKVVPPGASLFASKGILLQPEIQPFGIPAAWDMPLDFNWVRAKIKFSFFDWQQNQEETLPPGLIVEARRDPTTNPQGVVIPGTTRVGAGVSASAKDGTCYLLLEGDKTLWKECHLQFHTPGPCFIDLSRKATPSPDTRLQNGALPKLPDDFNRLPGDWHSHGMRGSFTTSPRATPAAASPPTADKVWDQLHFDLAADQNGDTTTINFHLDDVVICNKDGVALKIAPTAQPPTLFDHLLTILNPNPKVPYQTNVTLVGRVVPANVAYPLPLATGSGKPPALQQSTRLIYFEAGFHDLRDDRVPGQPGAALCVGARAALEKQHPSVVLNRPITSSSNATAGLGLQMHFIDVPGVVDPATGIQLQHLLIHIPVKIDVDPNFSKAGLAANPNLQDDARTVLNTASETWSPGHPGTPKSATNKKSYALVPQAAGSRNNRITRFRTFFAESTKNPKLTITLTEDKSGARANTAGGTVDDSFFFAAPPTPTKIVYFDTAVTNDIAAGGGATDSGDSATAGFTILTHELGHAQGLMDEYYEALDPLSLDPTKGLSHPFMPSFGQIDEGFSDWRPYYSDFPAMMANNMLPRLRHFWHHAQNTNQKFSSLPDTPYLLTHTTFKTAGGVGLTYRVPPNDDKSPWVPIFQDVPILGGRGQVALFRRATMREQLSPCL